MSPARTGWLSWHFDWRMNLNTFESGLATIFKKASDTCCTILYCCGSGDLRRYSMPVHQARMPVFRMRGN